MKILFLLAFWPWLQQLASSRDQRIEGHWQVDLDGDGKLESVAVLCEKNWGDFIIEAGNRRWDIGFPVDANTKPCGQTNLLQFMIVQGGRVRELGLRQGNIVVVRESVQEDEHEQPSRVDWDVLVKATKAKYPRLSAKPRKSTRDLTLNSL